MLTCQQLPMCRGALTHFAVGSGWGGISSEDLDGGLAGRAEAMAGSSKGDRQSSASASAAPSSYGSSAWEGKNSMLQNETMPVQTRQPRNQSRAMNRYGSINSDFDKTLAGGTRGGSIGQMAGSSMDKSQSFVSSASPHEISEGSAEERASSSVNAALRACSSKDHAVDISDEECEIIREKPACRGNAGFLDTGMSSVAESRAILLNKGTKVDKLAKMLDSKYVQKLLEQHQSKEHG